MLEEVRRTGKEPSQEWLKKWRKKWGPIPTTDRLYCREAMSEWREKNGGGRAASKEWVKKWREKWDKVGPNP